ncbi:MAG: hypothetical protein GEV03_25390 [Streptosporangiales bacterium]|nr:hypothetical protein [Streptosporangiales bacterium]
MATRGFAKGNCRSGGDRVEYESLEETQAELERIQRELEEKAEQLDALSEQLGEQRATASSEDETVWATVDGIGMVQDLEMFPEAMDRAHPERLGDKVVEAVCEATAQATAESSDKVRAVLPGLFA